MVVVIKLSAWLFESRAYLYFDILKSFLTWLCFSDFFFQHKAFLKAILYLGDLAVLSLFLMAWQWQPAIQLTFFRFLCHGSYIVLPCEQRPFVSMFWRVPSRRVAISLLACLAVDNRVTCLCCVSCSLPSLLVFLSARRKRFGSRGPFALDTPGPEAWNFLCELTITYLTSPKRKSIFSRSFYKHYRFQLPTYPWDVLLPWVFPCWGFCETAWVQSKYQLSSMNSQR